MIFITVGSQKFQFDRLLKSVDDLVERGIITEDVFAQTGYSTYLPQHYPAKAFLDRDEFAQKEALADIVITHGGTGAIIGAVKKGKKVIAVPRLARFGEHVDDHQLQIVSQFEEMNLISECKDCKELEHLLKEVRDKQYARYSSNTQKIIQSIECYIKETKL